MSESKQKQKVKKTAGPVPAEGKAKDRRTYPGDSNERYAGEAQEPDSR